MHRHPEVRKASARFVFPVWRAVMAAAALASMPVQSFAADCVPANVEDIDGNGLDDALVSVNAVVRNSDVACSTRIGAEIGEGVRIGAGATIAEQAIVPDGTVVPAGASFP